LCINLVIETSLCTVLSLFGYTSLAKRGAMRKRKTKTVHAHVGNQESRNETVWMDKGTDESISVPHTRPR
jgi:hypothetical protein